MTTARMLIIVPTRSRPQNVTKVVRAWEETDAFRHADLCFAIDMDDPERDQYGADIVSFPLEVRVHESTQWRPMVHKLDLVANIYAQQGYFALGFAGDDHLPRTHGWAARYVEKLLEMGTGVVSCPDGYRPDQLPTQWAMTTDIVRALGRMVPAPVEHLYCDNAVWDLAEAAGCYAYLLDVLIEHVHPLAGKTKWDGQYRHVNRDQQFADDFKAFQEWYRGPGKQRDAEAVRALIAANTAPNPGDGR